MIEIHGLSKSFGGRKILNNVDLNIDDGGIFGLCGRSGIGKSTIAKLLCGVLKPDAGEIYMDGAPLYTPRTGYCRKLGLQIQMVYQQPYATLDPKQTLLEGYLELIRYHHLAKNREDATTLMTRSLAQVNLEPDIVHHRPHQISGGEAQRVALSRSLLFHPRVLILDEATSMLDVSTQANILTLVRDIARREHSTLLLISHDQELITFFCDQIYEFDDNCQIKERKNDEENPVFAAGSADAAVAGGLFADPAGTFCAPDCRTPHDAGGNASCSGISH